MIHIHGCHRQYLVENKSFSYCLIPFKYGYVVAVNDHSAFFWLESSPGNLGTQPQVQVSPQNVEVHEGDTLRLYCRASGSPAPRLTWLKNGGQIPPQVSHLMLSISDERSMD